MNRTERITFVATPRERQALDQLSQAEGGLSRSAMLRRLVHLEAEARGFLQPQKTQRQGVAHAS